MARLSTDLSDPSVRPYFLWDEAITLVEFREQLAEASPERWAQLVGKLLREARDPDVWLFVTPQQVYSARTKLEPYLGRRRAFWHYLLAGWRSDGFVHD
jgi:hypothetical protein